MKAFFDAQRLSATAIRLEPADHDWRFLHLPDARTAMVGDSPASKSMLPSVVLTYLTTVPNTRLCYRIGAYDVRVSSKDDCPGDWLAYRADSRSTGVSSFRLNWSSAPRETASISLEVAQQADPLRFFAHSDPRLGERMYVNNGTSLEAFDASGQLVWRTRGVGIGEIIDVTDIDGDGHAEVIFSPGTRWNMLNPSGAGPGELIIAAAASGELLWRHAFEGVEFGLNRRRTTIVPNSDGPGKSIYAVMTYSFHVWRFDFRTGVRNGSLRWKSAPLIYDSPDKAPLVADFDGDGIREVIADSYGHLYAIRESDGTIISSLRYAPFHSFHGFMSAVDIDGNGKTEIVGMSNSIYMKDAFAARFDGSSLELLWRREWEHGLGTTSYEVSAASGVIWPGGASTPLMLWSTRDLRDPSGAPSLEVIDAVSGRRVDLRAGSAFVALMRSADGRFWAATTRSDMAIELVEMAATGFGAVIRIPASRWKGSDRLGRPEFVADSAHASSRALYSDIEGRDRLLTIDANGQVSTPEVAGQADQPSRALYYFEGVPGFIAAGGGGQLTRVQESAVASAWAVFSPRVFGTPIAADLDSDGRREIVVPFREGTGLIRIGSANRASIHPLVDQSPQQQRESFHVPLIARPGSATADGGDRLVVAFDNHRGIRIVASDMRANQLWDWPLPPTNWEPSLVLGRDANGSESVFYNDSRMTTAFEPASGSMRWTMDTLGQCQRQIAAIDWNDDHIADVALQSGETIYIVDGTSGAPLAQHAANTAYGGYVAATSERGRPRIAVHAVGGLTLVDAGEGMTLDEQLDERKAESIPTVIGRLGPKSGQAIFQISGSGRLRRMGLDGTQRAEVDLGLPVLTMTGAFVDDDNTVDLLVSTYRGEIVAVSGATLEVLWRIQLDGPAGPAVATDVDGDGKGEILVITGDGKLRVLGF